MENSNRDEKKNMISLANGQCLQHTYIESSHTAAFGNRNRHSINWPTNYIFDPCTAGPNRLIGLIFLLSSVVFAWATFWVSGWKLLAFGAGHRRSNLLDIDWAVAISYTFRMSICCCSKVSRAQPGAHSFRHDSAFQSRGSDTNGQSGKRIRRLCVCGQHTIQSGNGFFFHLLATCYQQLTDNDIHFFARNTFAMEKYVI